MSVAAEKNLWQCLQIRVTTFHSNLRADLNAAAIAPLMGIEPDSIEVKPNELRRFEVATLGPGQLTFTSAANRVDWVWRIVEEVEQSSIALGAPSDVVKQFLPPLEAWIAREQGVVRIAVGGLFVIPVENRTKGYEILDSLISELSLDPERTSEFLYQINRPSDENFDGDIVNFNNLEKWSCRQIMKGTMSFTAGSPLPVRQDSVVVSTSASCELDINTDASNVAPFSSGRSVGILNRAAERLVAFFANK